MSVDDQMKNGANLRSIWWISPAQYEEAHFAVMPEKVAEICIRAGCPQGGIVLDPFTGSGTTGVVSMLCQSNFIGIELNPEYAEMAKHRIGEVSPMFAEVDLVA